VPQATTGKTQAAMPAAAIKSTERDTKIVQQEQTIQTQTTTVDTEKYHAVFSNEGAVLQTLDSREFKQNNGKDEPLIVVSPVGEESFSMEVGGVDLAKKVYKIVRQGKNGIEYQTQNPVGVSISKEYVFPENKEGFSLIVKIKNDSAEERTVSYSLITPIVGNESEHMGGQTYKEVVMKIDEEKIKKNSAKGIWAKIGNISWTGMKNKYFSAIVKTPAIIEKASVTGEGQNIVPSVTTKERVLQPGQEIKDEYLIYAGPNDDKRIKETGFGLENIADYGWFGGISKLIIQILHICYNVVKNWGVAIIILTALINLLLFPLTMKSFVSMHQMKQIQPHMQKLKEVHKDNPQKMNKEMMELYKKYNINPLGGCLPIILQMPIFVALYQGLMQSIELRGAHFLWIKNLAMPDAIPLPGTLPLVGNHLNLLPIIMSVLMVVQQKISMGNTKDMSEEQAMQQKMMLIMMPILFGFIFYNMPSGLVLYWLANTILMTGEQWFLSKRLATQQK